jgi:hypothetical protein
MSAFKFNFVPGVFLGAIGTKILRLLFHAIHSHPRQLILLPFYGFLGLEISTATTGSGWGLGLALFTLPLCLPWKVQ